MFVMGRREFLAGATSLICLTSAGCLSRFGEFDPDIEPKKQLGEASGISFEVDPDLEYEYLEENDRVRIHFDGDDATTMAFDEFGKLRAAEHGSDRLQQILEDNSLAGTGIGSGWGRTDLTEIDTSGTTTNSLQEEFTQDPLWAPRVDHVHSYDRNGVLVYEPAVPFQDVVTVAPRSMEITILFSERNYTIFLPVICRKLWAKDE